MIDFTPLIMVAVFGIGFMIGSYLRSKEPYLKFEQDYVNQLEATVNEILEKKKE